MLLNKTLNNKKQTIWQLEFLVNFDTYFLWNHKQAEHNTTTTSQQVVLLHQFYFNQSRKP
jgi:hypothetical protein